MRRRAQVSICAEPGCPEYATVKGYCDTHKREPWQDVRSRRVRKGSGWEEQRRNRRVLKNWRGICHVCGLPGATVVDHVIPLAENGPDDESNLRPIHPEPCHREKTQRESVRGNHGEDRR